MAAVGALGEDMGATERLARAVAFAWRSIEILKEGTDGGVSLPQLCRVGINQGMAPVRALVAFTTIVAQLPHRSAERRLQFDLWGDTVNVASRLGSKNTEPNTILVPSKAGALLANLVKDNLIDMSPANRLYNVRGRELLASVTSS
eukprot:scaffold389_cov382-Prasinococcus_capsulatus_cf.AAC.7